MKWPTRRLCLFYLWNKVSSPLWWMPVAWACPNCPPSQQCVFILSWPLAQVAHPTLVHLCGAPKQCRAAMLLHSASVGQSPRGGLFSVMSVPNLVTQFSCFFVVSSMWMSVWLRRDCIDSLYSDTLHGFLLDIDCAARLPLSRYCSPFVLQQFFSSRMKLIFFAFLEAWNASFHNGIGRY